MGNETCEVQGPNLKRFQGIHSSNMSQNLKPCFSREIYPDTYNMMTKKSRFSYLPLDQDDEEHGILFAPASEALNFSYSTDIYERRNDNEIKTGILKRPGRTSNKKRKLSVSFSDALSLSDQSDNNDSASVPSYSTPPNNSHPSFFSAQTDSREVWTDILKATDEMSISPSASPSPSSTSPVVADGKFAYRSTFRDPIEVDRRRREAFELFFAVEKEAQKNVTASLQALFISLLPDITIFRYNQYYII